VRAVPTPRAGRHPKDVDTLAEPRAGLDPDRELAVADHTELAGLVRRQLELLGEDPEREALLKTPERVAKSLAWLTRGYSADVHEVIGDALFEAPHESMVMVRDIELYSLCEHHLLSAARVPARLNGGRPRARMPYLRQLL